MKRYQESFRLSEDLEGFGEANLLYIGVDREISGDHYQEELLCSE